MIIKPLEEPERDLPWEKRGDINIEPLTSI